MRIIRPYGTSATEATAGNAAERRRVLRRKPEQRGAPAVTEPNLEAFATTHAHLVIAQWISTIDKIAAKPTGFKPPTAAQRKLRRTLGDAALKHIAANGLLPELAEDPALQTRWALRLEPYPARDAKQGGKPEGRWYARFVGDLPPEAVDAAKAAEVAERIAQHLYVQAQRIHPDRPAKRQGQIVARAGSIARNVPKTVRAAAPSWTDATWDRYEVDDVAARIRAAAAETEAPPPAGDDEAKGKRRWVGIAVAAKLLAEHWPKVFRDPASGAVLTVSEVKQHPDEWQPLFDLHEAVRDVYRRLLKRHKKAVRGPSGKPTRTSDVARLLPATMAELKALIEKQRQNRDVNALIRQGKVLHYEAATENAADPDHPKHVLTNWPDEARLKASWYWTSDGQAEIKANEAFVRVWRRVLALMHRTATDWARPAGDADLTERKILDHAVGAGFDLERHRRKVELLFGARASWFRGDGADDASDKAALRFALERLRALRHKSFHFVGLGGFHGALTANDELPAARALWQADLEGRAARLAQVLAGVRAGDYVEGAQLERLFKALVEDRDQPCALPLPRFKRVLRRAANIREEDQAGPALPEPANWLDLEDPARLCQYTALKLVYERPFRRWLDQADPAKVRGYVAGALARTTEAARDLNTPQGTPKDDARRQHIRAKAENIADLAPDARMGDLVRTLMRETAIEMRVQRGYDSNAENAQAQARYIEDFLRDVVALAFLDYLREHALAFLLEIESGRTVDPAQRRELTSLPTPEVDVTGEGWQVALHFVLHLAPVDDVAALLHQLRKFDILTQKRGAAAAAHEQVGAIIRVFELYLDMHDAKFAVVRDADGLAGGQGLVGLDAFKGLFESPALFEKLVAKPAGLEPRSERIPVRGLREIARYGHLPPLLPLFTPHRITAADAARFDELETVIAARHKERQGLHDTWTKDPKAFPPHSVQAYVEALRDVAAHRCVANHVKLTAHVRLHRLLMAVLGRLLDFSGLFERDLYFAALALVHERGLDATTGFRERGRKFLQRGQILAAIKHINQTVQAELPALFPLDEDSQKFRNDFAHFNMLQPGGADAGLNLTTEVEHCRSLMRYDRKLKNAVTKAVIDLVERDGLEIEWTWQGHAPHAPTLKSRTATHLGGRKVRGYGGRKPLQIQEALHADSYVAMAAALFGGEAETLQHDIGQLDLARIDWRKPERKGKGQKRGKNSRR